MRRYSIAPRTRKYVRRYGFSSSAKNIKNNYWIQGYTLPKKVVHKAGEYLLNKIAGTVLMKTWALRIKSNYDNNEIHEPIEEIIIPPGKGEELLNKLRMQL